MFRALSAKTADAPTPFFDPEQESWSPGSEIPDYYACRLRQASCCIKGEATSCNVATPKLATTIFNVVMPATTAITAMPNVQLIRAIWVICSLDRCIALVITVFVSLSNLPSL